MTHSRNCPSPDPEQPTDPDALLAAVPGLLGFVPERSVVLMAFDSSLGLIATMRHDLLLTPAGGPDSELCATLVQLATVIEQYGAAGVVAVIVDDQFDAGAPLARRHSHRRVSECADRALAATGGLCGGFVMATVEPGAKWQNCWQPGDTAARRGGDLPLFGPAFRASGALSDPSLSTAALNRAVYTGRRVLPRRSDLPAMLTPIPHCGESRCRGLNPAPVDGPASAADRGRVALVLEWIESGALPEDCGDVNALAEALVSVHTRDALLGLAVTDARAGAERLWCDLARRLTGTPAAAAATLLGHLYYMGGEGVYAGIALEHALDADPGYRLAHLLFSALSSGMRPGDMGGLIELSFELAAKLGAPLPAPAAYGV